MRDQIQIPESMLDDFASSWRRRRRLAEESVGYFSTLMAVLAAIFLAFAVGLLFSGNEVGGLTVLACVPIPAASLGLVHLVVRRDVLLMIKGIRQRGPTTGGGCLAAVPAAPSPHPENEHRDEKVLRVEITYPSGDRTVYRSAPLKETLLSLGPPDAFICDHCGGETPMGTVHVCVCPACGRGVPMNLYDKAARKCRICTGEKRVAGGPCDDAR
jgi:hypothetical protein